MSNESFGDFKRVITVRAEVKNCEVITGTIEEYLLDKNVGFKYVSQICIAIDEIYSNIANYAYNNHDGDITVTFEVDENNKFRLLFEDQGIKFNPLEKSDPNINLSLEDRDVGGLGIFIVKQTMDSVEYSYENNTNKLLLEKNL